MLPYIRGKVWITGSTVHYIVYEDDRVIFYDNTGVKAWRKIYNLARSRVDSAKHLYLSGRKVKPYDGYYDTPPGRDR